LLFYVSARRCTKGSKVKLRLQTHSDQGIIISKIRALARLLIIFGLGAIHTLALADYTVVYSDYTISTGYTLRIGPGWNQVDACTISRKPTVHHDDYFANLMCNSLQT
jgi:hypothetical protein